MMLNIEAVAHPIPIDIRASGSTPNVDLMFYSECADIVDQIRFSEADGLEQLYRLVYRTMRFYLCRLLGPQELEDKMHNTFLLVVEAIRRGKYPPPSAC